MKLKTPNVVILGKGCAVKCYGAVASLGILQLQTCKQRPLGSKVKKSDITSAPFTIMFTDQKAVDALIEDLVYIKITMTKQELERASENKSVGHPNKQRKVSRKRKK